MKHPGLLLASRNLEIARFGFDGGWMLSSHPGRQRQWVENPEPGHICAVLAHFGGCCPGRQHQWVESPEPGHIYMVLAHFGRCRPGHPPGCQHPWVEMESGLDGYVV